MKPERDLFAKLGLTNLPLVTKIYLVLVILFAILLVLSSLPGLDLDMGPTVAEGLKTVLAALLGALSQADRRPFAR